MRLPCLWLLLLFLVTLFHPSTNRQSLLRILMVQPIPIRRVSIHLWNCVGCLCSSVCHHSLCYSATCGRYCSQCEIVHPLAIRHWIGWSYFWSYFWGVFRRLPPDSRNSFRILRKLLKHWRPPGLQRELVMLFVVCCFCFAVFLRWW